MLPDLFYIKLYKNKVIENTKTEQTIYYTSNEFCRDFEANI